VPLTAAARHRSRFLLRGTKRLVKGSSIAIRQIHEGLEVGRVTWQFRGRK
jgi:hypothetical protein